MIIPQQILESSFINTYRHPVLFLSPDVVRNNFRRFRDAMSDVEIAYAVKANPDPHVISVCANENSAFDVASITEIELLRKCKTWRNIGWSRVLYSNPIRSLYMITHALTCGVTTFVVDSFEQILALEKYATPDRPIKVYIRVAVSNDKSKFPLTGKFGVDAKEASNLIALASRENIKPIGITFHVGSQCTNIDNWVQGIRQTKHLIEQLPTDERRMLDIGGGFPVEYTEKVPSIEQIGEAINTEIQSLVDDDVRVVAEPGRYIVSTAGMILCKVLSTKTTKKEKWVYLDTGVFHGLVEGTVGDFKYSFITKRNGELTECAIAGPTCDSLDIVTRSQMLPKDLQAEDFVVINNCGAYTTSYGTFFNGFPPPETCIIP